MRQGRPGNLLPMTAESAVEQYRFAKHGSADDKAVHGTAAASALIGVFTRPATADMPVDVATGGMWPVQLGAAAARGDLLKSDANGKGTPVSAANDRYGALALESGVADDVVMCVVVQGVR